MGNRRRNLEIENAYNTKDPTILLELKRMEADALLEMLRFINQNDIDTSKLFRIAEMILLGQLGVRKMVFFYKSKEEWLEGWRRSLPELKVAARKEMFSVRKISPVNETDHPALSDIEAEYVVPIVYREDVLAYFVIADFADSEVEEQNDLIFIETLGNILSVAIRNKELFEEQMEQEFLKKELQVGSLIQSQMLISDFSRFREIDVFGMNLAHHGVGGDFFDIIKREKGTTFVCIADVSGKGIGAALLMSNLQANLRALCAQYFDPADIVIELNQILFDITQGDKFVTLFLARIDKASNTLTYVNAGHDYPVFWNEAGQQLFQSQCTVLGIMPELPGQPSAQSVNLTAGNGLFMYTDGLVDQENETGDRYDTQNIYDKLNQLGPNCTAEDIVKEIERDLIAFRGSTEASDDITMLSVKFL